MRRSLLDARISLSRLRSIPVHSVILALSTYFLYGLIITVANDVANYAVIWELSQNMGFWEVFSNYRLEFGSLLVIWIIANYAPVITTIFLTGLIGLLAKYWILTTYLRNGTLAFLLYVITFAHILDANQLRASLALCFLLYALVTEPKSNFTYVWLSFFAIFFHYSGIVILALYFTGRPLFLALILVAVSLLYDLVIPSVPFLSFALIWLPAPGVVSFFNSFWIMQVIILVLSIFYWSKLSNIQKRGALLNMLGVVTYIVFYDSAIIAHRVRELSQLGVITILFSNHDRLQVFRFGVGLCFAYIVLYNLFLMTSELALKV